MPRRHGTLDDETHERRIEDPPLPSSPRGEATNSLAALDITTGQSCCFTVTTSLLVSAEDDIRSIRL
jgi:hypothetical protein